MNKIAILKNEIKNAEMSLQKYQIKIDFVYSHLYQRLTDPDFMLLLITISFVTGFLISRSNKMFSFRDIYKLIRKFSVFS